LKIAALTYLHRVNLFLGLVGVGVGVGVGKGGAGAECRGAAVVQERCRDADVVEQVQKCR